MHRGRLGEIAEEAEAVLVAGSARVDQPAEVEADFQILIEDVAFDGVIHRRVGGAGSGVVDVLVEKVRRQVEFRLETPQHQVGRQPGDDDQVLGVDDA